MTAASAAYLNIAVEPTPTSLRSCLAPALGRGSPRAFGPRGAEEHDTDSTYLHPGIGIVGRECP